MVEGCDHSEKRIGNKIGVKRRVLAQGHELAYEW